MQKKAKKPVVTAYRDPYQDEAIVGALRPFWRAEERAAQRWGGIVRLQSLVSPELSARYGTAKARLEGAIKAYDADETAKRASVCIRGLEALDLDAKARGNGGLEPRAVYVSHHGREYVVAIDRLDIAVISAPEGVPVLSIQELLECRQIVLDGQVTALDAMQSAFQGASVSFLPHGDELPF